MALIVLFEKRNPDSFFVRAAPRRPSRRRCHATAMLQKHYLKMLQFPLCPAFFTDEQIDAIEYPWVSLRARTVTQTHTHTLARSPMFTDWL